MIGRVKYVLLITFFGWSISCKSGEKSSNAMGIEIGEEVQFKKLMRLSGNFE
ncbi:MAG: hypothetical protein KBD78_11010 [Oligoflexales bacterium]|nr:hypothetical protein [Oligoflexales bacterium]